ncbi:MAG: M15 family metallopeptidase [Pseudomonadota bacterium]
MKLFVPNPWCAPVLALAALFAAAAVFAPAAPYRTGLLPRAAAMELAQLPAPNPRRNAAQSPPASAPVTRGAQERPRRSIFGRIFQRNDGTGGGDARKNKAALLAAYPDAFRFDGNEIVFPSGVRVVWDDGRDKSPAELLVAADVEDMFAYPYPLARKGERAPPKLHDPGRVRSEAFFRALYGGSEAEVRQSVRRVPWVPQLGGGALTVTTRFGIDRRVAAISSELERLPPRFHRYLRPSAGAFLWRRIAGTRRLSVHSFGAAVDINTKYANYWRWAGERAGGDIPFQNQIPMEIVSVFEKHCFIWGGRWYHFDTMHFEYRPELLPGCQRG